jgi:hypothetical protein
MLINNDEIYSVHVFFIIKHGVVFEHWPIGVLSFMYDPLWLVKMDATLPSILYIIEIVVQLKKCNVPVRVEVHCAPISRHFEGCNFLFFYNLSWCSWLNDTSVYIYMSCTENIDHSEFNTIHTGGASHCEFNIEKKCQISI